MIGSVVRAIVLAAGASSRMGRPKAGLPLDTGADTFLSRIIRTLSAAGLPEVVIVTGAEMAAVRAAAGRADRRVRFVHNPDWPTGQLSSLKAGLSDVDVTVEAALVTLVDIPLVSAETVRRVLRRWRETGAAIVRPARGALHGHPVIFDRSLFGELRAADPAVGAKSVVRAHQDQIIEVPSEDDGAFIDLDTVEEYRAVVGDEPQMNADGNDFN
jgi:molybdenum cofactor cytidylyltransferase